MNFQEAVRYLFSLGRELAAPTQAAAAKFNLENIATLAEGLGHPERKYRCVHIAGTNGKGSTAAFLEMILRKAGRRTGLYTSPHLERSNERIRVNGEEISDADFAAVFTRIRTKIEEQLAQGELRTHPTFFECVTAVAFLHFAEAGVEVAVFETGLGGRLDATNIVAPEVSVITRIDFDHENFLGHSLREIAAEKAGIIKPKVPVVMSGQREEARAVLVEKARELSAPIVESEERFRVESLAMEWGFVRAVVREAGTGRGLRVAPQLAGRFQLQNALNALAAASVLGDRGIDVGGQAMQEGIAAAVWPGRIEKVHSVPDIYMDGAHNPAAARELATFLEENFGGKKVFLVFGVLRDKAVDEVAGILFPHAAHVIFTEPRTPRSISTAQLAGMASHHAGSFEMIPEAERALDAAVEKAAAAGGVIFVTGSLYLVGQLRSYAQKIGNSAAETNN